MNKNAKSDSLILCLGGLGLLAFPFFGSYYFSQSIRDNRQLFEQGVLAEAHVMSMDTRYHLMYSANETGSSRELDEWEYRQYLKGKSNFGAGASVEVQDEITYSFLTESGVRVNGSRPVSSSTYEAISVGDTLAVKYLPSAPRQNDLAANIIPTIGSRLLNILTAAVLAILCLPGLLLLASAIFGVHRESK